MRFYGNPFNSLKGNPTSSTVIHYHPLEGIPLEGHLHSKAIHISHYGLPPTCICQILQQSPPPLSQSFQSLALHPLVRAIACLTPIVPILQCSRSNTNRQSIEQAVVAHMATAHTSWRGEQRLSFERTLEWRGAGFHGSTGNWKGWTLYLTYHTRAFMRFGAWFEWGGGGLWGERPC